jgi:hypothetical protein
LPLRQQLAQRSWRMLFADQIADRSQLQVPLSRRIVALIKRAEAAGRGSPALTPEQIRSDLA